MQMIMVAGGTLGLSIFLIFFGLARALNAPKQQMDTRLEKYAQRKAFTFLPDDYETRDEDEGRLPDWLNERLEESAEQSGLLVELARADLMLTPGEWVGLTALSVVGTGVVGYIVFRVLILAVVFAILGLFIPRIYLKWRQQQRLNKFSDQLADAIALLANSLRAGYSLMQSMEVLSREMPDPIATEFDRVVREIGLGLSTEQALHNLLDRVPSDDLDMMITAITVQAEVGGNLAEILDILAHTIRERVRIQGEIRVLTAQQMFAGYILVALPAIMGLLIFLINREYMSVLYTTTCGWIMLAAAGLLITAGFFAIRKVVQIEV